MRTVIIFFIVVMLGSTVLRQLIKSNKEKK